jgi:hypothetical protein
VSPPKTALPFKGVQQRPPGRSSEYMWEGQYRDHFRLPGVCHVKLVGNFVFPKLKKVQGWSPLFEGVTSKQVSSFVKSLAIKLGYHGKKHDFASHSLRRGGATTLLNKNVPAAMIQLFGRWASSKWLSTYPLLQSEATALISAGFMA